MPLSLDLHVHTRRAGGLLAAALLAACATQPEQAADANAAATRPNDREARVAALFDTLDGQTARLRAFLQDMPKGGDLHNHLVGSVYAEDFLRWADEDGYCVKLDDKGLVAPPCKNGQAPARGLAGRDPALYE
ncbi:MAG: hypothetical protein ACREVL_19610, partial [Solimonas sp.]